MTKKELEKEILDLKIKIAILEARPQVFCAGHYCNCKCLHSNVVYPYYSATTPIYQTTISEWGVTSMGGAQSTGFPPNSSVSC